MKIKLYTIFTITFLSLLIEKNAFCQISNFVSLNGTTDYIEVPDNNTLDITEELTIEAWINPCDITRVAIINKNYCAGHQSSFHLHITDGRLDYVWDSDGNCTYVNRYISDNSVIPEGQWTHIAVVHTNMSIQFYVNGELVSGSITSGSYSSIYSSNAPLLIGVYRTIDDIYKNYYTGKMDEVRLWNVALASIDIKSRYNHDLTGDEDNLVAYYDLEDITSNSEGVTIPNVATATGVKNDGLTFGTDHSPQFNNNSEIIFSNSVTLNGITDYIEVPDDNSLDITEELTIEAWVNPCDVTSVALINKNYCASHQSSFHLDLINGKLNYVWDNNGNCSTTNHYISDNSVVQEGQWSHIAVVHSQFGIQLYVNGEPVSGNLISGSYSPIYSSNAPLLIGVYRTIDGNYENHYTGKMDEIRLWNSALTSFDINSRYGQCLMGNEQNLVAYYNMEGITSVGAGVSVANQAISTGSVINGTTIGTLETPLFNYSCDYNCSTVTDINHFILHNDANSLDVQIYPNPFSDNFSIKLNKSGNDPIFLSLYDVFGEKIIELKVSDSETMNIPNFNELKPGLYFIRITQNSLSQNVSILKN